MASNLFPLENDVSRDFNATVTFIEPFVANGQFHISALVSFIHGGYIPPTPPPIDDISAIDIVNAISGTALNVLPTTDATILSTIVTLPSTQMAFLAGCQCAGDTNANYLITINGVTTFRFFTNIAKPDVEYDVPGQLILNHGDVLKLIVYNTGDVISNYNGTLLGMFA